MSNIVVQPELPVVQIKFCANPECQATLSSGQKICWRCGCNKSETMEIPLTANFFDFTTAYLNVRA